MKRTSDFSKRIKEYREKNNLTLADMEKITGIPAQTINRYELGKRTPKVDMASRIAEALQVDSLWLQGYDIGINQGHDSQFRDKLKSLRKERNITQEQLAEIVGVERSSVGKWESKKEVIPSTEILGKLATYFNVTIDELLGRSPKPVIDLDKFKTYYMVGEGLKGGVRTISSPKDNKVIYLAELAEKMEENELDILIRFAEAAVNKPKD